MKKSLLFAVAALLWLSATAVAAPSFKEIETAFANGQQALKEQKFDEAVKEFTIAADGLISIKQPDKARLLLGNIAIIHMQQKQWQEAVLVYEKANSLPGKPTAEFNLQACKNTIVCADELGRPDLKISVIEKFLTTKPKLAAQAMADFLAALGDAYRKNELYALAAQSYEKALAQKDVEKDKQLPILVALGLCQGNLGRYEKAITNLQTACKLAEELQYKQQLAEANSNLGIIYWEMGEYDKAVSRLKQAIGYEQKFQLRRNEGVDFNNLGLVYKNAGQLLKAKENVGKAYQIALEVKNRRDEAIAVSNLALLEQMLGDNKAARQKYNLALSIYKEIAFQEGQASCLMGLAKIDRLEKNYAAALEKMTAAISIYEKLENPGFLAEAYSQLGQLYQNIANPTRRTRDLVFDDSEVTNADMPSDQALANSKQYFNKALLLARATGRKEIIWMSMHGLAYAASFEQKLAEAEKLYAQAIEVLLSMKGAVENPDLLQSFLYSKDRLFSEAIDVCAKLYAAKPDPELLRKQMMYDEIYRNEVMRSNMRMASLSYADQEKSNLYNEVIRLNSAMQKAEASVNNSKQAAEHDDLSKQAAEQIKSELLLTTKDADSLQKEFEAKLKLWKERYPQDAVLFDSSAQINTKQIQAVLTKDQVLVQYLPMEDSLIIITITKEKVEMVSVQVSYQELAELIRDKFMAENIEEIGRAERGAGEKAIYDRGMAFLTELNDYLYKPIEKSLENKSYIYFLTSKYLSYVPFAALITGKNEDGSPRFLIQDKTIALTRLSFVKQQMAGRNNATCYDLVGIANPRHEILKQKDLPGTLAEVNNAVKQIEAHYPDAKCKSFSGSQATKSAWLAEVSTHEYGIMYFATHGIPFAEIKFLMQGNRNENRQKFYDENFQNPSHLNGFLYLAYPDKDENGVLSMKNILELPDNVFGKANLAILSACNTAISYSPKVLKEAALQQELESGLAAERVAAEGWTPGVDQVCLVDTFMRRNFRNVYGSLWFADDLSSSFIMSKFMENISSMVPAEALRAAQLAYLENPPKELDYTDYPQHPYYWACGSIFGQ